ncbi:tetratricopeptide repeat protein [uncultured Xylophilus sp.]|uniref:tetratricopeptide repeat protein n=1 Tax=uncultured Xylophilus sp. TaxID=296832 RepID=UPI0025D45BC4|nr:tetratricopeptide repeat protein [uncultured Xylophilus sp.]
MRHLLWACAAAGACAGAVAAEPAPTVAPAVADTAASALAAVPTGASAASAPDGAACEARARLPAPDAPGALDAWQAALSDCQRDSDFLAMLGRLYLEQGRYVDAADHLERALMFDPDQKGARVDYAIALAGVGDALSSLGLIRSLLADPDLPARLRPALTTLQAAWQPAGQWRHRLSATLRAGHDSNLAGAPNLTRLTLTPLDAPPVEREVVDGSLLARPGSYLRADAQIELRRDDADGSRWELSANLRRRRSHAAPEADSTQGDAAVERTFLRRDERTGNATGAYAAASAASVQIQSGTRYAATGVAGGWAGLWREGVLKACQARAGLELQSRRYLSNEVLSGRYLGGAASFACDTGTGGQWLAAVRHGADNPTNPDRPGGRQVQSSVRVATYLPLTALAALAGAAGQGLPGGLLADLELGRYTDSQGYRPFLDNNRVRETTRTVARLEYQLTLSPHAQWTVGAEWLEQRARLSLFRLSSKGPYTSLRVSW